MIALRSPNGVQHNWCVERTSGRHCGCVKARFPGNCPACDQRIRLGDCIGHLTAAGWGHVCCRGDERRGIVSIKAGFRRTRDLAIEDEERASVRRRLTYGDEKQEDDNQEGHSYTDEQHAILDHVPAFDGSLPVSINALAGCGKTTTIALLADQFAEQYPDKQILYLVFNKKNQEEAKNSAKFPKRNMEIRNTHSFVLRHYFGVHNMKCFEPQDDYTLEDIEDKLDLVQDLRQLFPKDDPASRKFQRKVKSVAAYVRKTLHKFQESDEDEVSKDHVFWRARKYTNLGARSQWRAKVPPHYYQHWASTYFEIVRERCHDVKANGSNVKGIAHDGYMKVCQLECDVTNDFDFVIVDEAQDMTDCQADLFWGDPVVRKNRAIYLFGDRYQQLYRFRGASNSFSKTWDESPHKFHMTGSFRFGIEIARVASIVLKVAGGEELTGMAADPGEIHDDSDFERGVVLCRTNQGIYRYLLHEQPSRWCYLDGTKRAFPEMPQWVQKLEHFLRKQSLAAEDVGVSEEDHVAPTFKHRHETFRTVQEIEDYIEDEGDLELHRFLSLLQFLIQEDKNLAEFQRSIRRSFVPLYGEPDGFDGIVLGTVHKAKGLEFSNVLIHNDFSWEQITNATISESRRADEINILYVALTRAKDHLFLSPVAKACLNFLAVSTGRQPLKLRPHYSLQEEREAYEEHWKSFASRKPKITDIHTIPMPPKTDHSLLGMDSKMTEAEQRSHIRKLRLRYHPDRFFSVFGILIANDEVSAEVKGMLGDIIQACTDAMRDLRNPDERMFEKGGVRTW